MSSFKKASKVGQKTHRERSQPQERQQLGHLEKHRDYVRRAKDYNDKRTTLKLLRRRALDRNPDEFYHHMINSRVVNGVHRDKDPDVVESDEDTLEQRQLMRTQDLKYVSFKRTQEHRRIERLQSELHMTGTLSPCNFKIKRFENVNRSARKSREKKLRDKIAEMVPDVSREELEVANKTLHNKYVELTKRIQRERELTVIESKLRLRKALDDKNTVLKPKKVKKGTKHRPSEYKWTYERKK